MRTFSEYMNEADNLDPYIKSGRRVNQMAQQNDANSQKLCMVMQTIKPLVPNWKDLNFRDPNVAREKYDLIKNNYGGMREWFKKTPLILDKILLSWVDAAGVGNVSLR